MPLTNYPHGVSSFGVPVLGMGGDPLPVPGNIYFVHPAADGILLGADIGQLAASNSNPGTIDKPLQNLSQVHNVMTANQNDTAILIGNSSASSGNVMSETSVLTWSKNLCHIVGTAYNRVSHRVSVRNNGDGLTPFITVSADGCVFANFHVFDGNDTNEATTTWTETGQRNAHYNLHIGGMGATGTSNPRDQANSIILLLTGDGERYFKDCVIGLDTADRGAANTTLECQSAAVRDWFEDCFFPMQADANSPVFLRVASGGLDRWIHFKQCMFHNGINSTATALTQAFDIAAGVGGTIILDECNQVGASSVWDDAAGGDVVVNGALGAATGGLMVSAS